MGIFIEATTEPFNQARGALVETEGDERANGREEGYAGVRRPVRGLQLKNEEYATLRVIGPNGQFFQVIDAAGEVLEEGEGVRKTHRYTNFFVSSVQEQRMEKKQVVDTFGDPLIFLFGEAPRMVKVQGTLLNTADFNWRNEFWYNYERYFRATRLAQLNARLYLIYDDRIIEGLMLSAQAQQTAQSRASVPFTFDMFVTGSAPISIVGDPEFPRPTSGSIDFTQTDSYERGLQAWDDARRVSQYTVGQKLLEANKDAFIAQTLTSTISDMLTGGFLDAGVPDVQAFLGRAGEAAAGIGEVFGDLQQASSAMPTTNVPIRSSFIDNVDEFIGGTPQVVSESLADRFSEIGAWQEADIGIDDAIIATVNQAQSVSGPGAAPSPPFDPVDTAYYDMMGRAGRADQEIADNGGSRGRQVTRPNFQTPDTRSESLREVPFGLMPAPGEFPG